MNRAIWSPPMRSNPRIQHPISVIYWQVIMNPMAIQSMRKFNQRIQKKNHRWQIVIHYRPLKFWFFLGIRSKNLIFHSNYIMDIHFVLSVIIIFTSTIWVYFFWVWNQISTKFKKVDLRIFLDKFCRIFVVALFVFYVPIWWCKSVSISINPF